MSVFMYRYLASGSGDTTVRFWDINTETPHHCCQGCLSLLLHDCFLLSGGTSRVFLSTTGPSLLMNYCGTIFHSMAVDAHACTHVRMRAHTPAHHFNVIWTSVS